MSSDPGDARPNVGTALRLDLIIATLALLASAGATLAILMQTRIVGNQLSASVAMSDCRTT